MHYEVKKLDNTQMEFTVTVAPADYQKYMEEAAERLSARAAIKGFRPGKAPYAIVKEQLGEIKILEEAMEPIVQTHFLEAMKKETLETVGGPQITLEKMAPGNDFVFKAVVALMPKVKLLDLDKIKVEKKAVEVSDTRTDEVLKDLGKMQVKEILKNGAAEKTDKVVVDLDMFIDKVPVEGGQAKGHQVYLDEPHYIPGFAEQLIGLKKDETKEFSLKFPKEHYQKHLADKNVDLKVKVNDVFELQYPPADEAFAKSLGQPDLATLKKLLKENLIKEAEQKEEQRQEIALLEELINKSEFGELPKILIDSEKNKMFHELRHNLEHQGIAMEQYLKDLKKTEEEIYKDFTEQAEKRAKAALVSRQVALDNNIKVEPKELQDEIEKIKLSYADTPNIEETLKRPEILDTIAMTVQNRKVIAFLKDKIFKKE